MTGRDASPDSPTGRVILITGMSGAGRSTALHVFEDMGYEAVDNLPLSLLGALVAGGGPGRLLAIGVDIRTRDFAVEAFFEELRHLRESTDSEVQSVFLECEDEILVQRYTETRRRHPLADDRPVPDGIKLERRLLEPVRESADLVIDTSATTPWALKRSLSERFAPDREPGLAVFVTSFSYRHGLPREADLVMDVRFLRNPHYVAELRPLTGRDPQIGDYVREDSDFDAFFARMTDLLDLLLPRFEGEGKSYLTIAVGCTGGRHRSVFVAEQAALWLDGKGWRVHVHHRDLRDGRGEGPN